MSGVATMDLFKQDVEPDWDGLVDKFDPKPHPHLSDPAGWVREQLKEDLWSKQREIADSVMEHRYTAVPSSHDTGKSYIGSRLVCHWMDVHPEGTAFSVTTAPTQTQVEAILWREIGRAHRKGSLPGRITSGAVPQWKLGPEIVAYGRKPQDLTSKEVAMAAFQGIHAKYVLIVIDEAGGVPRWLFDAVDTLATNQHARVLAIGNPDDPSSHFAEVCKPGSGWNVIQISAFDTPAFTGEEVHDDLLDLLVSPGWVEERKRRWGVKAPIYISKVLGKFPKISNDTLVPPWLLQKGYTNDLSGEAVGVAGTYGYDIARQGDDRTVGYRNRGGMIRKVMDSHQEDTMVTAAHITKEVKRHKGAAHGVIDIIGIGAGVYDRARELRANVVPFQGSEKAYDSERYHNRRAEVYWEFRESLERQELDLDPHDQELAAQLGSIKWKVDSKGRIQIESKDDIKKRTGVSPDHADGCVMSTVRAPIMVTALTDEESPHASGASLTGDLLDKAM